MSTVQNRKTRSAPHNQVNKKDSRTTAASLTRQRAAGPWHRRQAHALACLGLIALSLAAYANSFAAGFALDWGPVLQDPRVREATLQNLRQIISHTYWWPSGEAGLYRPLTTLSWLFNYAILGNGVSPLGYHWVNWLLHAVNVLLVFALTLRLGHRLRISFFVAALWAVHPVLTEAVTNVAGRSDLLGGMTVLGGFLLYLRSADATGLRRAGWLAGLAVAAAAGAGSKESAVILPAIIVLYEFAWRKPIRARALLAGCVATLVPIGAVLWLRSAVLAAAIPAEFRFTDNPIVGARFWVGRLTALEVIARYLWITVWPVRLSSDYSYAQIPLARGTALDWIAWTAVAAATVATFVAYRRNRLIFFFACFALLTLLPASNLLFPTGTIMAERLLYLPSIGLVGILVITVEKLSIRLPRPSVTGVVLLSLIATGYTVRTWIRNFDWRDDLTMATVSVQTSPESFKVHRLLAADLLQASPSHSNIDRVVAEADRSVAILAGLPDESNTASAWNIAARAHLIKGDLDLCSGDKADSQSCKKAPVEAHNEFVRAERCARRSAQIEDAVRNAYNRRYGTQIQATAVAAESYRIMASAHLRLGKPDQALEAGLHARALNPSNPEVYEEIADADLAEKHGEVAAVVLVEGMFVTSDPGLREDLLTLYRSGLDKKGCALAPGSQGPALNPACDIVHRDFCAAAANVRRHDVLDQLACHD